jgi:NhaC family Na+:H+ antiporter
LQAYEDKGLAPENLSRTLKMNCDFRINTLEYFGAYQSGTLGVSTIDYLPMRFSIY